MFDFGFDLLLPVFFIIIFFSFGGFSFLELGSIATGPSTLFIAWELSATILVIVILQGVVE